MAVSARWDAAALRAGAGVALMISIPITVVAALVNSDSSVVNAVFFFGAISGFVLGAGCAAWVQRVGTPMSHGIVTASATYLLAQLFFVTIRLVRGDDVNWYRVFFTLMIVVMAGYLGGSLGNHLQRRGWTPSTRS